MFLAVRTGEIYLRHTPGDIMSAAIIINSSLNGGNGCYISFSRTTNTFYLFRDSNDSWLPITPCASSSVTNNCTLAGTGLSVPGAGSTLTVVFPLSFKAAFSGARITYISLADAGGLSSGWIVAGTWNVP